MKVSAATPKTKARKSSAPKKATRSPGNAARRKRLDTAKKPPVEAEARRPAKPRRGLTTERREAAAMMAVPVGASAPGLLPGGVLPSSLPPAPMDALPASFKQAWEGVHRLYEGVEQWLRPPGGSPAVTASGASDEGKAKEDLFPEPPTSILSVLHRDYSGTDEEFKQKLRKLKGLPWNADESSWRDALGTAVESGIQYLERHMYELPDWKKRPMDFSAFEEESAGRPEERHLEQLLLDVESGDAARGAEGVFQFVERFVGEGTVSYEANERQLQQDVFEESYDRELNISDPPKFSSEDADILDDLSWMLEELSQRLEQNSALSFDSLPLLQQSMRLAKRFDDPLQLKSMDWADNLTDDSHAPISLRAAVNALRPAIQSGPKTEIQKAIDDYILSATRVQNRIWGEGKPPPRDVEGSLFAASDVLLGAAGPPSTRLLAQLMRDAEAWLHENQRPGRASKVIGEPDFRKVALQIRRLLSSMPPDSAPSEELRGWVENLLHLSRFEFHKRAPDVLADWNFVDSVAKAEVDDEPPPSMRSVFFRLSLRANAAALADALEEGRPYDEPLKRVWIQLSELWDEDINIFTFRRWEPKEKLRSAAQSFIDALDLNDHKSILKSTISLYKAVLREVATRPESPKSLYTHAMAELREALTTARDLGPGHLALIQKPSDELLRFAERVRRLVEEVDSPGSNSTRLSEDYVRVQAQKLALLIRQYRLQAVSPPL